MRSCLVAEIMDRTCGDVPRKERYLARNELAKRTADLPPKDMVDLAHQLWRTEDDTLMRAAVHPIHLRPTAIRHVGSGDLERMGSLVDHWGDVDAFCPLTGTLWRIGRLPNAQIRRWARSDCRWWRRSTLVTLIAKPPKRTRLRRELIRVRGGHLDPHRILPLCEMLVADRDDMVVKAMSWVLRQLSVPHLQVVRDFLQEHEDAPATRVLREVRNKLETGVKNPKGGARARWSSTGVGAEED